MNASNLAKNRNTALLISGLAIVSLLLIWVYSSGQHLSKQSSLLVDKVMQLRVDLSQSHYLIHEGTESTQAPLDIEYVRALIKNINDSAEFIDGEEVQMGRISGKISNQHISQKSIRQLKESLEALLIYLEKNHAILNRDQDEDIVHDQLFSNVEMIAEEIDEQVHEGVAMSLEQQNFSFIAMFALYLLLFVVLFLLLKRSNKIQAAAYKQSAKLSQALEHSGEGTIIASTDGVIEFVNDAFCQMTGYSRDETLGNNPSMLSSGKQSKAFYKKLWSTISAGKIWRGELYNRKKDGSIYPALMTIAPIFDQAGSLTHYIANQQDVTEHNAVVEQLNQAQKLESIGTLAGGIAHDFNNCLTGISGNIFLMRNKIDHAEYIYSKLDIIQESCNQAATHIKQLLSFSRKDAVFMGPIEINSCVKSACSMAISAIPKSVNLTFSAHSRELYVHWNETQAQQILINLINNSCHALKNIENPSISIGVGLFINNKHFMSLNPEMTDEKYICLSVKDNGSGIPADIIKEIFDPFFTTKKVGEGTGLGLSMAYGAIKKIKGTIEVESVVGEGTEFKFYLPIEIESENRLQLEPKKTYKGDGETVLIADDDSDVLLTQSAVLELLGYKVIRATNGQEAVEAFENHADDIDIVILDVVMPVLTGPRAARKILGNHPNTKIIFATGYDNEDTFDQDFDVREMAVIYKPYSPETISRMINEELKKKSVN